MQRLFVALSIPDAAVQAMALIQGGVPGARWQTRGQLHLTLRFIGEVDGRGAAMIDDALAGIEAPGFTLEPHGVGQFGNKHPHALDRKSTRLNSSHVSISYAVFCLKKKNRTK